MNRPVYSIYDSMRKNKLASKVTWKKWRHIIIFHISYDVISSSLFFFTFDVTMI